MSEPYIPSPVEEKLVEETVDRLKLEIENFVDKTKYKARVVPVGSIVKGTFLKGDFDIDIFVVSDNYNELYQLANKFKPQGFRKEAGDLQIWNFREGESDIDLVFVPPNWEKIQTLGHTDFYIEHLGSKQKNEIRKAKAFFKTYGTYGAEVGGIVGVAIEELVRTKGDLKSICKFLSEEREEILWLQDPTITERRNLLASINKTRWKQIRNACQAYIVRGFHFEYKEYTKDDFVKRFEEGLVLTCNRKLDKGTDFSTALSVCEKSANYIKSLEPEVEINCDVFVGNKIVMGANISPKQLTGKREVCIPVHLAEAISAFENKHNVKMYDKDGFKCALVDRKIYNPQRIFEKEVRKRLIDRGYKC